MKALSLKLEAGISTRAQQAARAIIHGRLVFGDWRIGFEKTKQTMIGILGDDPLYQLLQQRGFQVRGDELALDRSSTNTKYHRRVG